VLDQQFFVETRAGAGGMIGVQFVAHAEPDGYDFVVTTFAEQAGSYFAKCIAICRGEGWTH
jgi:tripartite-type tricarboxylate transporter receptor subunit TctC